MRTGLFLFILALSHVLTAQNQAFTTVKTTTDKARNAYTEGKQEADKGERAIAQGYFENAIKADPKFIDAHLALADVCFDQRNYTGSEKSFENAIRLDTVYAPLAFYRVAKAEWALDKYEEAIVHLESYLRSKPQNGKTRGDAERLLASARVADWAMKHPVPFNPVNLGEGVNTAADEYFPTPTADGETLIFTRNEGGFPGDENFYRSTLVNGVWQKAVPLEGVNTPQNEGAQSISPDGTWLVFTACDRSGDGSQGSCDLYWSQEKSTGWTKPAPFSATINSSTWDSQPTISADGKSIIFSSRRPGGRGREDLWITRRQPNGKWTTPENLGPGINTGGVENTPFLHPDGRTLYFASDSLPGLGLRDLFVARRNDDGTWGAPQNLGYPINTKADEVALAVSLDGKTAYFATNRPGSKKIDIYSFELPEYARPKPVTYAKVKVKDNATGNALSAKLEFIDLKTGVSYTSVNTRKDGTALVCLPAGYDYALNVSKDKYFFYSENFNLVDSVTFANPFLLDVSLLRLPDSLSAATGLPGGTPIVLRNVFFETGSADLRPESAVELDRLADLLKQTGWIRIQLNGHTDNVGGDTANRLLSENRARSVYDYLIRKGVAPERLKYKGFGESKPIDTNDTPAGRAKNRRTEFETW